MTKLGICSECEEGLHENCVEGWGDWNEVLTQSSQVRFPPLGPRRVELEPEWTCTCPCPKGFDDER
jgi:hypothetical protein